MNEKIYRKALEMLKERIDLYGTVIDPTPEDMRFICTTMQDIINNALSAGKEKKSYDKDRNQNHLGRYHLHP